MKYQHNIPIHCSKSTELETSSSAQIVTIKHGYCLKYKYWAQKTPQQTQRFSGPTLPLLSIYLKHNWFHYIFIYSTKTDEYQQLLCKLTPPPFIQGATGAVCVIYSAYEDIISYFDKYSSAPPCRCSEIIQLQHRVHSWASSVSHSPLWSLEVEVLLWWPTGKPSIYFF